VTLDDPYMCDEGELADGDSAQAPMMVLSSSSDEECVELKEEPAHGNGLIHIFHGQAFSILDESSDDSADDLPMLDAGFPLLYRLRLSHTLPYLNRSLKHSLRATRMWPTISWEVFSMNVAVREIVHIVVQMICSNLRVTSFKIGATTGILWRFYGGRGHRCLGHYYDYDQMFPLSLYTPSYARWAERTVIRGVKRSRHCRKLCRNRAPGGEAISGPETTPVYLYLVVAIAADGE
jgi:hypothetical protein